MRVISMQQGGDIGEVFARWCRGVKAVQDSIEKAGGAFMYNDHLGFIGTCPSNIGTGLRASMFVVLKLLGEDVHRLEDICSKLGLQPRGSHGEHTKAEGGMYDISNKARIGCSEAELVQTMVDGVGKLIEMEKALEKGDKAAFDALVAGLPAKYTPPKIDPGSQSAMASSSAATPTYNLGSDYPKFTPKHTSLMA